MKTVSEIYWIFPTTTTTATKREKQTSKQKAM